MEGDFVDHDDDGKSSPRSPTTSSSKKHSRGFKQFVSDVRVKMKLRGLEKITGDHYLHNMATAIHDGLQAANEKNVQREKNDMVRLKPENYTEVDEHLITMDNTNKEALFRSYAPNVFRCLRGFLNISCVEYLKRLEDQPYLQYKSNSRSGQIFFMSNDKRYFLKTESRKDAKVLLRILPDYVTHLTNYPHSLLVRIHGLCYIKLPGKKGKFFSVMQSVFPPEETNTRILSELYFGCQKEQPRTVTCFKWYDLKGCVLNRYVKPEKEGSQYVTVLKDVNFGDQKLCLRDQRNWFLRQVDLDVEFLKGFNIMDYSLLVEQRMIHDIERERDGDLADLVSRVSKSIPGGRTRPKADLSKDQHRLPPLTNVALTGSTYAAETPAVLDDDNLNIPGMVSNTEGQSISVGINNRTDVQYNKNVKGSQEMSEELGDFELGRVHRDSYKTTNGEGASLRPTLQEHNQRLLPNVQNAIHVVDGEEDRYFLGLIDILGQYTLKKRMETMLKSCIAPRTPFSSVSSAKYAKRFKDYVAAHTE